MKFAYTNAQMRAMDERTIAGGVRSADLMERAGKMLSERVKAVMNERTIGDVIFVCGGGNNGGDGFAAARFLREEGYCADVLCLAEKFSPDCEQQKSLFGDEYFARPPRRRYALIVDCLFGTGLSRAPAGVDAFLIDFINSGDYVIACDMPSGLSGAGVAFSPCVRAHETVTMGALKQGLLLADGADVAGKITVCDIGICVSGERGAEVWEDSDAAIFFPKRKSHTNKGSYGRAAIVAGDAFSGAAFLAAGACLKSGAGYTSLFVSDELYPCATGRLPTAVLQKRSSAQTLLQNDCIALGMGMGVSEELYSLIVRLFKEYTGTLLLDADALNALSRYGAEVLKEKKCNVILTPHVKEFSRLCGKEVAEIMQDSVCIAQAFAEEYGVTLVFKNNRTVVTNGERTAIITTGSPCLAKGGSGDVLAGLAAGTLARGVPVFEAGCCSAYVLGRAGEIAARNMGEYAPDAQDIINYLPEAMRSLLH